MSRGPVFHITVFSASAPQPLPVNHMQAEGRVSGDRKQDKPTTMFSVLRKECKEWRLCLQDRSIRCIFLHPINPESQKHLRFAFHNWKSCMMYDHCMM